MSINNPQVLAWCHRSTDVHADNNVKPLRTVLCSEYGKCDPASTRKQTQVQGRNNKKAEMLANKVSNIAYTTLRNCKAIPLAILSRWSLHFRRQHYLGIHIILEHKHSSKTPNPTGKAKVDPPSLSSLLQAFPAKQQRSALPISQPET